MASRKFTDDAIDRIFEKHEVTDDNLKSAIKDIVQAISKDKTFVENIEKQRIKNTNDRTI